MSTLQAQFPEAALRWDCSICRRVRRMRPLERENLCENCYNSKKNSPPISLSEEEWSNKLKEWSPTNTISDIPTDVLLSYLIESSQFYSSGTKIPPIGQWNISKTYLVYISRCVRVSKEWQDYFNDSIFWKHAFVNFQVDFFYERKLNLLMSEKYKKIKTSKWSNEDIRVNKCRMIVINETKNIPYDIYWISKNGTKTEQGSKKKMHTVDVSSQYYCGITYTNSRWMCIPTKEWLRENPYSTIGFSWTVNVLELKAYIMPNGKEALAFVVRIRDSDFNKMNPIKDINKNFKDYRKKIIPIVFDEKDYENKWTSEKENRKADIMVFNEARKKAMKFRKYINESEKRSKDQMYILNMFN